jgi:hypothetical protein
MAAVNESEMYLLFSLYCSFSLFQWKFHSVHIQWDRGIRWTSRATEKQVIGRVTRINCNWEVETDKYCPLRVQWSLCY